MKSYNHEHYTQEFNETARRSYASDMEGSDSDKGLKMYSKPYLWDEAKPASHMDIPAENFVPTQSMHTDGFSTYSTGKKIATIGIIALIAVAVVICGVLHFSHY